MIEWVLVFVLVVALVAVWVAICVSIRTNEAHARRSADLDRVLRDIWKSRDDK